MRVRELREMLATCDQEALVCGNDSDGGEYLCSGMRVETADEYHPSLPEGTKYLKLRFTGDMKPKVVIIETYRCRFCQSERESTTGSISCRHCSWMPMMLLASSKETVTNQGESV